MTGDAVRQLLAAISAEFAQFRYDSGTKRLLAALTAVLDKCVDLERCAGTNASDYAHGSAHGARVINRAVAAALEEQP